MENLISTQICVLINGVYLSKQTGNWVHTQAERVNKQTWLTKI